MNFIERWTEIDEFLRYLVSNAGHVANRFTEHVITPWLTKGYHRVRLTNSYGQKNRLVHRLVAAAFFEVDITDFEINHIDGDKSNNFLWNLEVVTPVENVLHAYYTGLNDSRPQYYPHKVLNMDTGELFETVSSAARSIKANPGSVSTAARTPGRTVKGFRFEFVD